MSHITVVNGPASGTHIALARGETCTIGSGPACTIRIETAGVAEVQAEIKALKQDGFGIKRAGGPVAVNGASIEAARLKDGDVIDIGSVKLVFGPPVAAAPSRPERPADRPPAERHTADKSPVEKGRLLGGFKMLEVLGKGGMGTVYRAEQVSLHRQVALKVLDQALTQDPVFVARFVAEARAAARLHHPNVVQVYDVGHEGSTYYYSMELMTEGSLETKLKSQGKLELATACAAVIDAARGLAYAESLRIVHRDIKPDNLMLDHHGSVKLADLGLAMTDEDGNGAEARVVGTPHFMSPEQILRKALDHRSDLYSLGCTFYRALTGKNPFSGAAVKDILRAQVKDTAEPAHKVVSEVPVDVSLIVQRLMEKEPGDRFQSANDLVEALETVLRPPTRKGVLIGGIVVAVLIAGAAIAYALTRPEGKDTERVITKVNPEDEANAKRAREALAEAAYLRVQTRGLTGLALADALDAMAKEHAGSEHATKASAEAVKVRADVAASEAAAAQRSQEIERWTTALRARVRTALAQLDFRAATAGLAIDDVPEGLRGDQALIKAKDDLAAEVQRHADAKLRTLIEAAESACNGDDIPAIERAGADLAAALEGDGAWPKAVLTAPEPALSALSQARGEAKRLRAVKASTETEAGWGKMHAAFTGSNGVLSEVRRLHWQAAAQAAERVPTELTGQPAGEHAAALAQSLVRAVDLLARVKDAAQAGSLTMAVSGESEPCAVSTFIPEGEQAGFTVKVGPKHQPRPQVVKFTSLPSDALERALTLPSGDNADVACVLGWFELARQAEAARIYLATVDPSSDASGTGQAAYAFDDQAATRVRETLGERKEPWAVALRDEIAAASLLAQGLQAFSGQRNLAAAQAVERLQQEYARSLVVAAQK